MARVLMPLPSRDFDPSEAAIPWKILRARGYEVVFATPDGKPAAADDIMLSGRGLDVWGFVPGLDRIVAAGLILRANRAARLAYGQLEKDPAFLAPRTWTSLKPEDFDGLLLAGGHRARGVSAYLESEGLQALTAAFFRANKPIGAICHGVLIAARAKDPVTGRSSLYGRKTTALTWPLESAARHLTRFTRFWDPQYYATYPDQPGEPEGTRSTEAEVKRALASPQDFRDVPKGSPHYRLKTDGLHRDTADDDRAAFIVEDGNYISARWPGDVHAFSNAFVRQLEQGSPPS